MKNYFFFKLKKIINYTSSATLWQKKLVAEVTFKNYSIDL